MVKASLRRSANMCPECGSTNIIHDYEAGEIVCTHCGLVIDEMTLDTGPEWRAYTREEKESKSRVGTPISHAVHDKGLTTTIRDIDRDAFGRKLPLTTRLQMGRLRKWQIYSRVHGSVDRNLAQAMAELYRISDALNTPSIIKEKAAVIYRKALDKGLVRGRSIAAVVAAALYAAYRGSGAPRTLREIAEVSLIDREGKEEKKKEVARCYRLLLRQLGVRMPINDPLTYVSKIAEQAGISGKTQGAAIRILREVRKKRIAAGKSPVSLATASLYIACLQNGEEKNQKDIARAAGVTEVTLRNRYKTLKEQLNLDLPHRHSKKKIRYTRKKKRHAKKAT